MHWIDWFITLIPVALILGVAVYSRKYIRGVADYISAGRVAGRYVIAVGDLESIFGLLTLVALIEAKYQVGFGLTFWENCRIALGIIIALTGYCVYRFRETKSLSIGQFLEMRYNRPLRVFASFLKSAGDTLGNAIGPAVAAKFFIYFLGFPHKISLLGLTIPTFMLLIAVVLTMAMVVVWSGGRVALLITDCLQGLMSYPIFVIIVVYILCTCSWNDEIIPVLNNRVSGESFINPFDVENLRDFNIFALVVLLVNRILNRGSWLGNDSSSTARTPHEQKMASVLGVWRSGFLAVMSILLCLFIVTVMSHENFSAKARQIRIDLADKVSGEVVHSESTRAKLMKRISAIPEQRHRIGIDDPLSQKQNLDTVYLDTAETTLGNTAEGQFVYQKFNTLYKQMMMAVTLRKTMPVGIAGIFCLMMVMLMISTDDSRIVNCSSTIIQDVILPFKKTPLTPRQHVLWLRMGSLGVAVFFFVFSAFFVQLDYINMFITIMLGIWSGGAGPVMIFGLYSRFGNTAGAFASLFVGSGVTVGGVVLQNTWAKRVYPFLENMGWAEGLDGFLRSVSSPFSPYIKWEMNPAKFPINSMELFFIAMMGGLIAYIGVSLLTYRRPYNLERLLHRGRYSIDGEKKIHSAWTWKSAWDKLIGITPEYTRGDRIIAWSVFGYSFIYRFFLMFCVVLVWNAIYPWPASWWNHYYFYTNVVAGIVIGAVSTVWFMIGGIRDARRMFKDLAARVDNPLDDGRVEGHVSLMDKAAIGCDEEDADDKR
ncbi:sodium:panthothenate symporter [bacterium]|nr:sodium:panthothenate symporter [candidate division CSSED10-310 bacterium]